MSEPNSGIKAIRSVSIPLALWEEVIVLSGALDQTTDEFIAGALQHHIGHRLSLPETAEMLRVNQQQRSEVAERMINRR